jgi:hypothetical protein
MRDAWAIRRCCVNYAKFAQFGGPPKSACHSWGEAADAADNNNRAVLNTLNTEVRLHNIQPRTPMQQAQHERVRRELLPLLEASLHRSRTADLFELVEEQAAGYPLLATWLEEYDRLRDIRAELETSSSYRATDLHAPFALVSARVDELIQYRSLITFNARDYAWWEQSAYNRSARPMAD